MILIFVNPWITDRSKPVGGVICDISTTSTTWMPSQNRSTPLRSIIGSTVEVVSTTIEMPSRKQPRSMENRVGATIGMTGESPMAAIRSASWRGMPVKPDARLGMAAPVGRPRNRDRADLEKRLR